MQRSSFPTLRLLDPRQARCASGDDKPMCDVFMRSGIESNTTTVQNWNHQTVRHPIAEPEPELDCSRPKCSFRTGGQIHVHDKRRAFGHTPRRVQMGLAF